MIGMKSFTTLAFRFNSLYVLTGMPADSQLRQCQAGAKYATPPGFKMRSISSKESSGLRTCSSASIVKIKDTLSLLKGRASALAQTFFVYEDIF